MYALAVSISRDEDAVQTCMLATVQILSGIEDIPCGRSWKNSCQSCKEVGKADRTDVGNTCPSPTPSATCPFPTQATYLRISLSPIAQFLQSLLNDRTFPFLQKSPITFLRQFTFLLPLFPSLPTLLLELLDFRHERFHRFFEFIVVSED